VGDGGIESTGDTQQTDNADMTRQQASLLSIISAAQQQQQHNTVQRPAPSTLFHKQERSLATAFSVAGPLVWKNILAAVREADTVSSFKRKLKTHFFTPRTLRS